MADKDLIGKRFSRAAAYYDRYAIVQQEAAQHLLAMIEDSGIKQILEIGCGTGSYTELLKQKFPCAQIEAVDISKEMVAAAKSRLADSRTVFITADAECMSCDNTFSLITSNVCFQWFDDLGKALMCYKNLLQENCAIYFSIFGPRTFFELSDSLLASGKSDEISARNFLSQQALQRLLKMHFAQGFIQEKIFLRDYANIKDLLLGVRYTSAMMNSRRGVWTQGTLRTLERRYIEKYGKIRVTYQVFFCKAQ